MQCPANDQHTTATDELPGPVVTHELLFGHENTAGFLTTAADRSNLTSVCASRTRDAEQSQKRDHVG